MIMNWKTSHNILYIILFKIFISKLDYFFIIYTILLSLSSLDYSQEEIYNENGLSIQQHQINSYLKGPENQSVLFNTNTIMSCRVYYKNYIISKLSIFYEDYLSVQWIIDGFGVNNESLKDVHGDRYSMPGSIEQGNFDLRIRNAQLEDEASFICQANIKIYSNSGLPPQLDTITSKPAYLTVIYPPSELTLLHLPEGQTLATINPLSIPSNKHSPTYTNGLKENHYSTEDLGQIFDRDLSRIVADDPESESSFGNSKQFIDPLSQITDEQQISQMLTLKPIAINQIAPSQPTFIHNSIPKLWIPENKHLVVACRSSPSKPATSIQWHLAGTLLIKHPDLSKYFEQHSESDQSNKSYFLFNDHNHLFRYSIEEKVVNVSDKSLRKDDRTHGSEIFVSTSERNSADDVQMQVTQSQLTLFIERKYQHWQLECGVSNPEDFKPAKLPTITASIEPMYIENVKIRIVNYTDQVHFREDQSVNFECITNTNPKSPLYSWTIGNSVPSVEYETLSFILDSQSDTKRTIDNEHEHSLIGIQSDVNTLELTVNRAMHQKRIRCWVGVESPDLMYQITNGSLQGFLSNKDSSCVSDCRKLRNSLRKRLKNMIWAKGDYRLDIMYGPAFLNPMNDLYSGELGQIVNLECSADSNPEPNVFWYYIGPEGQTLLEDLTRQELNQYQHDHFLQKRSLINKQQSKHIMWNSETELVEFNTSVLKSAIFSHGRKLLTSKAKHVSHQLHLLSHANFGFYACIAQSPGYPAIYRAIYVGQAASPKVVKVDQWIGYEDNSAKLFCLVYSIPRPTVHQIIWSKNGIVIKPDKRLRIYQEKTHRGATSVLAFRILRSNDFSSYNCTVFNDYGSDWKLITLSHDSNWPLTFAFGSGLATLLAAVFVTVICCFTRYARMRRTNSKNHLKLHKEDTNQRNKENEQINSNIEMKSMLNFKSLPFDFINSSYREDAIQSSQEYCPVESQYKSDSGISNNEGGVVKLTNHNFKSTNIQISEGNESTDFVKENYINCITSSCPEETILLPRFYSLTEKPISSSMNSSTDNHYHNPYCEIQSTDHQLNSTINNISYLNTSNYSVNIIPSIKHSDMTSIVHTNSWTLDTRDSLISSPPTLPSLSLPYNNESSLHPIFLMTSNLNYSPTMNQHSTNSSSTTVLIPPVIFDTSNNQNILYNPCSPSTNTSFLLNTNNNIIPDISIIPFNENHFQQENHQQQEE